MAIRRPAPGYEPNFAGIFALPDFLRLVSGEAGGVDAFMAGKVKLKGDVMLAQRMLEWFDIPEPP